LAGITRTLEMLVLAGITSVHIGITRTLEMLVLAGKMDQCIETWIAPNDSDDRIFITNFSLFLFAGLEM